MTQAKTYDLQAREKGETSIFSLRTARGAVQHDAITIDQQVSAVDPAQHQPTLCDYIGTRAQADQPPTAKSPTSDSSFFVHTAWMTRRNAQATSRERYSAGPVSITSVLITPCLLGSTPVQKHVRSTTGSALT